MPALLIASPSYPLRVCCVHSHSQAQYHSLFMRHSNMCTQALRQLHSKVFACYSVCFRALQMEGRSFYILGKFPATMLHAQPLVFDLLKQLRLAFNPLWMHSLTAKTWYYSIRTEMRDCLWADTKVLHLHQMTGNGYSRHRVNTTYKLVYCDSPIKFHFSRLTLKLH